MTLRLSEVEFLDLFTDYPKVRRGQAGDVLCPHCGNALSAANLAVYEGQTEAGTGFTTAEIKCDICHKTAWKGDYALLDWCHKAWHWVRKQASTLICVVGVVVMVPSVLPANAMPVVRKCAWSSVTDGARWITVTEPGKPAFICNTITVSDNSPNVIVAVRAHLALVAGCCADSHVAALRGNYCHRRRLRRPQAGLFSIAAGFASLPINLWSIDGDVARRQLPYVDDAYMTDDTPQALRIVFDEWIDARWFDADISALKNLSFSGTLLGVGVGKIDGFTRVVVGSSQKSDLDDGNRRKDEGKSIEPPRVVSYSFFRSGVGAAFLGSAFGFAICGGIIWILKRPGARNGTDAPLGYRQRKRPKWGVCHRGGDVGRDQSKVTGEGRSSAGFFRRT